MFLFIILLLSLIILIRQFFKFLIKDKKEFRINKKILLLEDYTKITNLLTDITMLPNIKRCNIVKVVELPIKGTQHVIKILFSRGEGSIEFRKNYTYFEVDDFYINFIENLKKDELVEINLEEIEDCFLKKLSPIIGIKELVAIKLISNKNKLIYCTLSSNEIGSLGNYLAEIKVLKVELQKLISSVF
ncbi:MAG: hypothetical protein ABIP51_15000 [Bacteroidia bacterium]